MSYNAEVIYLRIDDWQVVYVNDVKVTENHRADWDQVMNYLIGYTVTRFIRPSEDMCYAIYKAFPDSDFPMSGYAVKEYLENRGVY